MTTTRLEQIQENIQETYEKEASIRAKFQEELTNNRIRREALVAYRDGKTIQYKSLVDGVWKDYAYLSPPSMSKTLLWRVKPEPTFKAHTIENAAYLVGTRIKHLHNGKYYIVDYIGRRGILSTEEMKFISYQNLLDNYVFEMSEKNPKCPPHTKIGVLEE